MNLLLADLIEEVLKMDDQIHTLANELYKQRSLLIMGRGYNYATCLEGALVSLVCQKVRFSSAKIIEKPGQST
jgi:fructoselysine-6-P-deglycase FrlB-like protein